MKTKITFFTISIVLLGLFVYSGQVEANWSTGLRIATQESGLSDNNVEDVLEFLMLWTLRIFLFLAIISFVITGIMFILSGSSPALAEKAKKGIWLSIIGIVVGLSALIILNFFINLYSGTGEFSPSGGNSGTTTPSGGGSGDVIPLEPDTNQPPRFTSWNIIVKI